MRNGSTAYVGRTLAVCAALLVTACDDRSPQPLVSPDRAVRSTAPGRIVPHPRNAAAERRAGFAATAALSGISIHNTVVQLGVNPEGHLNVPGFVPSFGLSSTTDVGLRFFNPGRTMDGASEATAPGCLCEGWGIADATAGVSGYANVASDGVVNLEVESFTHTTASAVSTVLVRDASGRPWMRVTHDYHPSPATQYLYEATVTVENVSGQAIPDLRYRRVMDWDIAPNTFNEYVTIQGTAAENVLFASDDGFQSADPLGARSSILGTGDMVDSGPEDHGALFDFGFGALPAGQRRTFTIFYGAAGNQRDANQALANVGAEVFSFGQASYDPAIACDYAPNGPWQPAPGVGACEGEYGAVTGEPHTFIFAFRSVGGDPVFKPLDLRLYIMPTPMSLTRTDAIAVWVPSTASFDATRLNPASATLGNESDPEAAIARRTDGAPWSRVADFNRDGRPDMLLVFRRSALADAGDLSGATTKLVMRASHAVEGLVRAEGAVRVVP